MAITDNETTTTPTNGKRITDEVRRDIDACTQSGEIFDTVFIVKRALLCDLDRIDEKHKKAMDDSYRDGYQEGKRDGDDEWYEEHESYLEEHGWYQALDADKQVIKFNDDVEWELPSSGETEHGYVVGIKIDLIADRQSCRVKVVRDSDFQTIELMAKNLHHVKPAEPEPTVEDLLLDMHRRLSDVSELYDVDSDKLEDECTRIITEYAAKLRLAGDE